MSFSKWYADVVLPGEKASSFVQAATFSSKFEWANENTVDKITYLISCDSSVPEENVKIGRTGNVVINGYKSFVDSLADSINVIGASSVDSILISSSSSLSSSSSSSYSSSLSLDPFSSSSSESSLSSTSSSSSISSSSSSCSSSSLSSSSLSSSS